MTGDKLRSSVCREVTVEVLYVAKFNSESKIGMSGIQKLRAFYYPQKSP